MNIDFELEILTASRIKLAKIMSDLSDEELLTIPKGFNNNIFWHLGHIVVSQQRLIYSRSGLPINVSSEYEENFKIGTSPKDWKETPDFLEVKESLFITVEKLKEDLKKNIFINYEPLTVSMGVTLNNHLKALTYANFHESEHTGNIQYLIKMIQ
jgi:hypothetical protein